MTDLLHQLPALIGVMVGALSSYLATNANERSRWRREQESRWDEARAQAYADYGHAVKRHHELCKRVAAYRGLDTRSEPLNPDETQEELARAGAERAAKWERVLLLGNPDTVAAGRIWHRRVWQIELFARGLRNDSDGWRRALDDVVAARAAFYEAARHDLGIKSGRLPVGGPWEGPTPVVSAAD